MDRCPACKRKLRRGNEANRMLWLLYHEIAEKLKPSGVAYSADIWHRFFASRFLGCDETMLPGGKTIIVPRSTSALDVEEFSAYLDKVQAFAAERNIYLADMEEA